MKIFQLLIFAVAINASFILQAQVAINMDGSAPDNSAILDVSSTSKGLLPPRMTSSEIIAIVNPAEGLFIYNAEIHKPVYYDGTSWRYYTGAEMLYIGKLYQGGVIFYLNGSGGGLICAVSDQGSASWGCEGTGISGADGTAIGTGAQNTIDIEAGCSTTGIAADICANLSLNGYTDWFLPSRDELHEMCLNKDVINATATANGGSSFLLVYWSSSEYNNQRAQAEWFPTCAQIGETKGLTYNVRPVRAF